MIFAIMLSAKHSNCRKTLLLLLLSSFNVIVTATGSVFSSVQVKFSCVLTASSFCWFNCSNTLSDTIASFSKALSCTSRNVLLFFFLFLHTHLLPVQWSMILWWLSVCARDNAWIFFCSVSWSRITSTCSLKTIS